MATNQVEQLATCLFKKMAIQNKIDVLDRGNQSAELRLINFNFYFNNSLKELAMV